MKKRVLALTVAILMFFAVTSCSNGSPSKAQGSSTSVKKTKVVFITTNAGLGDRSFNDSAWAGVQRAEKELGVEISVIQPKAVADFGTSIVAAVNSGANVVLGFGGTWKDAFTEYCEKYPKVYFGGLNSGAQASNLVNAMTSDHEGSYLVGALAAMMSKTGIIGAIGGQDGDNINRFLVGYEEGAKYVNPQIKVLKSYVGSFNDPVKGKEYALQLKNEKADIVYQVAGGTGNGVFEAVKESEGVYAIGVDANQDYIVQGKILTSMMKNCDVIAYDMIKSVLDSSFKGGNKIYNLQNKGIGISPMEYTKTIIGNDKIAQLEAIKGKIISGEIKVTDLFKKT